MGTNLSVRFFPILLLLFVLVSCDFREQRKAAPPIAIPISTEVPVLTILGTFHFAGSSDFSAIVMDSIYSKKRQREIDEVILRLKQFHPTKIVVEREPSLNDSLTKMLNAYLETPHQLPKNELYQLGFKLAAASGLDAVYGADYQMEFDDVAFSKYLSDNQLLEKFEHIIKKAQNFTERRTRLLKHSALLPVLIDLNESRSNAFNKGLYTDQILNISDNPEGLEVEIVTNWLKRNLHIKKNLDALLTKHERVILIMGAGHKAILEDFYKNSPLVKYISINDYLKHGD